MFVPRRAIALFLVVFIVAAPWQTRAAEEGTSTRSPQDLLSAVPGDAWAVVCTPSVAQLDKKIVSFAQQLQLPMMGSPVAMGKMMLGIMSGFDDAGGLAAIVLPAPHMGEIGKSIALLVPTSDYNALLQTMAPEPADGGLSKLQFMDKQTYAAKMGKFAVLAESPETVSRVLAATTTLGQRISKARAARLTEDDLSVWLNMSDITSSQLYAGLSPMLSMLGMEPEMFKQFSAAGVSLQLGDAGIKIGIHMSADPESEIGRGMSSVKATGKSLLTGLPDEPFVIAAGFAMSSEAAKQQADMLEKVTAQAIASAGDFKPLVETVIKLAKENIARMRHFSLSLTPLPSGSDGMIGLAGVVTTDGNSKEVCASIEKLITALKESLGANPDAAQALELVEYNSAAEKHAGMSIDHLKVSLPLEPGSDDLKKAMMILGKSGVLFRFAVIDDNHVAVTFGGGPERLAEVAKIVKANAAPLGNRPEITGLASNLPAKKYSEFYIAIDEMLRLVQSIGKRIGEDTDLPETIPSVKAPIAVVSTTEGKAGARSEILVPMKLIRAAKDVWMQAAMAKAQAPQGQAEPTPAGTP